MGTLPTASSHGACAAGIFATDAAAVGDRLRRRCSAVIGERGWQYRVASRPSPTLTDVLKPQIQALNRTAPMLPMMPTTAPRRSHDYQRNGTIDLFAALDIATGRVITDLRPNHTSKEFIKFLNKINREVPAELDVHVVLDNLSTHKTPAVHKWLLRHRRFHFHFTPTYGSWMNLVERWFSALTTKKLQRSAHDSVNALAADIIEWVEHWNENPTPVVWHKTADEILERLGRYCADLTNNELSTETS